MIVITVTAPEPPTVPGLVVASETIGRYQDLSVTVSTVANVSNYHINVYDENGSKIQSSSIGYEGGTATIYGYTGWPVGTIQVSVRASNGLTSSDYATVQVTVTDENRSAAPSVTPPEVTTVARNEQFVFSVTTAETTKAAVRYYPIGYTNEVNYSAFNVSENETTAWSNSIYSFGSTYAYSFSVCIDGRWSEWSDFYEISVE